MSSYDSNYDSEKSVKKYLSCPARCNAPKCVSLQFPPENSASNINNMEYGGIEPINSSSMRYNFEKRMQILFAQETEVNGVSAGGGEYVFPIYKTYRKNYLHQRNTDFGYQKLKQAYGIGNEGQCKIHYEDY